MALQSIFKKQIKNFGTMVGYIMHMYSLTQKGDNQKNNP